MIICLQTLILSSGWLRLLLKLYWVFQSNYYILQVQNIILIHTFWLFSCNFPSYVYVSFLDFLQLSRQVSWRCSCISLLLDLQAHHTSTDRLYPSVCRVGVWPMGSPAGPMLSPSTVKSVAEPQAQAFTDPPRSPDRKTVSPWWRGAGTGLWGHFCICSQSVVSGQWSCYPGHRQHGFCQNSGEGVASRNKIKLDWNPTGLPPEWPPALQLAQLSKCPSSAFSQRKHCTHLGPAFSQRWFIPQITRCASNFLMPFSLKILPLAFHCHQH